MANPPDSVDEPLAGLATFLPWQQDQARAWLAGKDRFAHAWLIHGLAGIGKTRFALAAAASLLCESPVDGLACGRCAACRWVALGNHPDVRRIRPDAVAQQEGEAEESSESAAKKTPSREIRVEQLRSLHDWFNTATHRGGWRVAVLYPAQALNMISANALLKVLEEPPEHTVFLLVADAPDRLLPTLVSRCRRLALSAPPADVSLAWLAEQGVARAPQWLAASGGAPLLALERAGTLDAPYPDWLPALLDPARPASDAGVLADGLEPMAPAQWIDTLQRVLVDLSLASAGQPVRYYPGLQAQIAASAARTSPAALAETAKWLASQSAIAGHPLNAKLFAHAAAQRILALFASA